MRFNSYVRLTERFYVLKTPDGDRTRKEPPGESFLVPPEVLNKDDPQVEVQVPAGHLRLTLQFLHSALTPMFHPGSFSQFPLRLANSIFHREGCLPSQRKILFAARNGTSGNTEPDDESLV